MFLQLGKVACQLRNYTDAQDLFENSLKTIANTQAEQIEAEIFYSQAILAQKQGYLDAAREKLTLALERFQSMHLSDGIARTENLLHQIKQTLEG